jgi:hypothetical protein
MTRHIDETQLNDYVEGLLTGDVTRTVDLHLAACDKCSGRLEALTVLLSELAELPDDATPARDLWSGVRAEIEAGMGQGEEEIQGVLADEDIAIPIQRGRSAGTRRFSFSAAQLLAASVVLTLLSGGSVWMALTGGADEAVVAATDITPVAESSGGSGSILPAMQVATMQYEQAIASLESILEQGRDRLDPQTIATIEASLGIIDRAIGEARQALIDDPNNPALSRLLIKHEQSKLRVLRQASAAVQI